MSRNAISLALLALGFSSLAAASATSVSGAAAPLVEVDADSLALRLAAFPIEAVAMHRFGPLPDERIEQLKAKNRADQTKRYQIGIERPLHEAQGGAATTALRWQAAPGGGQVARLAAHSPGAKALRLGLDVVELPDGAELRFFADGDYQSVVAPITAGEIARQRATDPTFWTPITEGEIQFVELHLPRGAERSQVRLRLAAVSHFVVSPFGQLDLEKIGESQACQFDAKCVSSPSQAYVNAKNAVARMVFQVDGSSSTCSGTLFNDTDTSTTIPHFFSAAHCFTSQSVANTLATLWFQEATGCRTGVEDSTTRQVAGGAQIEFADAASDVLLVRLNNNPPAGAFYTGWSATPMTSGTEILVLHHPSGDVKKVSTGQVTGLGTSSLASGQFIKVGYLQGSTEGGSSGSALLTLNGSEYIARGGLLGGGASCANSGSLSNANNSDDYSRLDLVFNRLQPFLAPSTNSNPPTNVDYTGAWGAAGESGWGLFMVRGSGSGAYGMTLYHYDQNNRPIWYLMSGPLSGSTFTARVLQFRGPWFGTPPFSAAAVSFADVGNLTVNFTSATSATLNYTIDGRTVNATIGKVVF